MDRRFPLQLGRDVKMIRKMYATGKKFQEDLTKDYGISSNNISNIITGATWKHLPLAEKK